jgi:DNA-3-methyladenine glycosylase
MHALRRLARRELPLDTTALARYLIGKVIVRKLGAGLLAARIVETEAYLRDDAACHAFRGMTERNRALFLERGHAYVYLCYGTSFMLNVASQNAGIGEGVLLRAAEPLSGAQQMRRSRAHVREQDLARGPGRLAAALRIDRRFDGVDLCRDATLWLGSDGYAARELKASVRIGITKAADLKLRFYEAGSRFLSGPKALNA